MPNANVSGRFLFYKQLAGLHTKANLFYKLLFESKWYQSIQHVLCRHAGRLLRSGFFEVGRVAAAGIKCTFQCENRWIWADSNGASTSLRCVPRCHRCPCNAWDTLFDEISEHVKKETHQTIQELPVLNTHSWNDASLKQMVHISCHDFVATYSKYLGSSLLRAVARSVFTLNTWQQEGRWNSIFQDYAWKNAQFNNIQSEKPSLLLDLQS